MRRPETSDVGKTALREGDWIREAFQEYQAALVGYVQHLLDDLDLARDVVQDAFLRLCREETDTPRNHVRPWLFTVCRRRALDLLRKERRMQSMNETDTDTWTSQEPDPAVAAETRDQLGRALRFLRRLPENQREVLVLKFQNALSYQEISHVTGLSVGNVGFLIHTALKTLRRWLEVEPVPSTEPERRSP
jgi:RNA polymerase sigma-70 factor (ECF subfamily)